MGEMPTGLALAEDQPLVDKASQHARLDLSHFSLMFVFETSISNYEFIQLLFFKNLTSLVHVLIVSVST
ncbi:hypothetical protein [Amphibacillus sediminis]|uniref:hypothetical protein n=1 Tax=Amphibacillus sediminis TaxID=360185 RepID=UPI0008351F79|nr:hypothetical protein [Amphibacillus sediminis]